MSSSSSNNNNNSIGRRVLSDSKPPNSTSTTPNLSIVTSTNQGSTSSNNNNNRKKVSSVFSSKRNHSPNSPDMNYTSNITIETKGYKSKNHEKLFSSVVPSSPSSPLALPNTTQGKSMHAFEQEMLNDYNNSNNKQPTIYQQPNQVDGGGGDASSDGDESQKSLIPSLLLGLRSKTMTALIITFFLIMALCVIGLSISFDFSFRNVENIEATDSILKLSKALQDDFTILANRLYEYSAWDDVYTVLEEQSATNAHDLLASFFSCDFMEKVNLNFAMYYLPNGTFLTGLGCYNQLDLSVFPTELINLDPSFFSQVYEPTTRMRTYIIPSLTIQDLMELSGHERPSNSTTTDILMVTVQPTQMTDNSIANGLAIFASYITMKSLEEESKRIRLCSTFYNVENEQDRSYLTEYFSPPKGQSLEEYISLQETSMISPNDTWTFNGPFKMLATSVKDTTKRKCVTDGGGQRISSFKILSNYKGKGQVVMRTDMERDIYNLGWYSFLYTIISFLILVFVLTLSVLLFVEFAVLRRVIKIGSFVRNVTTESDISKRIQNMGRDELGNLSRDINKMLEALEFSQEKLARDNSLMEKILERTALEEEKSRCVMNSITDFIVTVECSTGLLMSINSAFETKILKKKQSNDAKAIFDGHDIFEYLKEFTDINQALEKLNQLSHTEEYFETIIMSGLGSKYPISVNVNKAKMTLRDGQVGEAFIVVMKNLSEQKDLRNQVQQEKLSQIQQITKFEKMMNDQDMRKRFRAFAEKEQSVENFLFIEDVEVFKTLPNTKDRAILQEAIIQKYLKPNSEHPLNVSQKVLETEYKKITTGYGQLSLFDRLETIVKGMILGDTFQRFLDSEQQNDALNKSLQN